MHRKSQHGVALIEFALIVPLILILALVTAEFGRALYRYNGVVKAVRNATRYLTTEAPDNPDAATRARNLLLYGKVTGGIAALDPDITADMIQIPATSFAGAAPDPVIRTVTVTVSGYTFRPMFSDLFGVRLSEITFSDISATMRHPL